MVVQRGLFDKMAGDEQSLPRLLVPRYRPMVVPPNDWRSYDSVREKRHHSGQTRRAGLVDAVRRLGSLLMLSEWR